MTNFKISFLQCIHHMIQFLGFNGKKKYIYIYIYFFFIYEINSKSLESESKGQFYNNSCFLLGHRDKQGDSS